MCTAWVVSLLQLLLHACSVIDLLLQSKGINCHTMGSGVTALVLLLTHATHRISLL
jgi:hypothetical protein